MYNFYVIGLIGAGEFVPRPHTAAKVQCDCYTVALIELLKVTNIYVNTALTRWKARTTGFKIILSI